MTEITLKAEEIFKIGNYVVTNSLILSLLVSLLLLGLVLLLKKNFRLVPGLLQNFFELLIEQLLTLMESVLGSRERAEKYLPLVATIFIFIFASNWLGLLPGVGSFVLHHGQTQIPLLRSPASDLNFTLALAILAVISTNLFGILIFGFVRHFKKFLNFKNPLSFFVGLLEFISEISKVISFSFRLFGNIFAGEVLLTIMFFLMPYLIPLPFLILEMFFGFIQAFIFAMLTLVFISVNVIETAEH